MFKELGAMMNLLGNRGKIQEEVQKFQAQVGQITAEATSGAGYVTVKVSGKLEVLSVRIAEEAMKLNDREVLDGQFLALVPSPPGGDGEADSPGETVALFERAQVAAVVARAHLVSEERCDPITGPYADPRDADIPF